MATGDPIVEARKWRTITLMPFRLKYGGLNGSLVDGVLSSII